MPRPRYVEATVAGAVETYVRESPETRRLVRVVFPVADVACAIPHGLRVDPSSVGRRIVRGNAGVIDAPGVAWTDDCAFLQADTGGAEVWIEFFVLPSEPESVPMDGEIVPGGSSGGGGVTDHGALTGLADNDHTQYARWYLHTQAGAATPWTVNHNLGYRPVVTVLSTGLEEIEAAVVHVSVNQAQVSFSAAQAGYARCV